MIGVVLFWCLAILYYLGATAVATFVSLLASFLLISRIYAPGDDSPALGLLWFMAATALAALFVPVSLGFTAEIIERKVQRRHFRWLKALVRFLLVLPALVGPLYSAVYVWGRVESARPKYGVEKEIFLYSVSAIFAFLALRIRKEPSIAAGIVTEKSFRT